MHPSSNQCLALPRLSAMLGEVADLPWSAPYALKFLAYFGAAGFLLVAKRSEGARCLLYSLWVFSLPALLAQHRSRLADTSRLVLALPGCANSRWRVCNEVWPASGAPLWRGLWPTQRPSGAIGARGRRECSALLQFHALACSVASHRSRGMLAGAQRTCTCFPQAPCLAASAGRAPTTATQWPAAVVGRRSH